MPVSQTLTRFLFTSHITVSIGWLGAVLVFLALAVAGLNSGDHTIARSAYIALGISAWFIIVPLAFASLTTGIIQATVTRWGLLKHYWIAVKLFLTIAATLLLLLHMKPIEYLSELAGKDALSLNAENGLRVQLITDAGLAILLLISIITISVYKPWGLIAKRKKNLSERKIRNKKRSIGFYLMIILVAVFVFLILKHLLAGGMSGH